MAPQRSIEEFCSRLVIDADRSTMMNRSTGIGSDSMPIATHCWPKSMFEPASDGAVGMTMPGQAGTMDGTPPVGGEPPVGHAPPAETAPPAAIAPPGEAAPPIPGKPPPGLQLAAVQPTDPPAPTTA